MVGIIAHRPLTKKERVRAAYAHAEGREVHVPARKVIVRSPVRILRELTSVKMGCKVPCESRLEYDHYVVLDARNDVVSFRAQPELFRYQDETGTPRLHYPDARVELTSGAIEIHEVKTDKEATDPEVASLHRIIRKEYARQGQRYVVVVESVIRRQPRLRNAEQIRSVRMRRPSVETWALLQAVLAAGPQALGLLQEMLGDGARSRADLLALTYRGHLDMDWQRLAIDDGILVGLTGDRS